MTKVEAAVAFFQKIATDRGFLVGMMESEMSPELIRFIGEYARVYADESSEAEEMAGSLMILGYLIRAYEDDPSLENQPVLS